MGYISNSTHRAGTLSRFCIGSLDSAYSVGNKNKASLQKGLCHVGQVVVWIIHFYLNIYYAMHVSTAVILVHNLQTYHKHALQYFFAIMILTFGRNESAYEIIKDVQKKGGKVHEIEKALIGSVGFYFYQ